MRILCLLLFCSAWMSSQPLRFSRLTDHHYVFTTYNEYDGTAFPANGMYVVTSGGVVLIDTPWDATQFQPLLDSIAKRHGKEVVFCLSTHFHADRTAGLDYYRSKGIRTWSSAQTKKWCIEKGEPQAEFTFENDTVFTIGGTTFRAFYPGKGHSPDNIVVWFEDAKILHGGCFVKSTENDHLGNLSDADVEAWPRSVRRTMAEFPDRVFVIPGHFGWEGDGLKHTLELLMKD